jgi:ATP-binding cassette subfamily B protein
MDETVKEKPSSPAARKAGVGSGAGSLADVSREPNLLALLRPYRAWVFLLVLFALLSNGITLVIPQIISHGIDAYARGTFVMRTVAMEFAAAAIFIFLFTYLQNIVQTYVSELVARDMRGELAAKISLQSQAYVQEATPAKLLTNLTSDVDGVKLFVSQAVAAIVSSLLLIIGSSVLLLMTDWRLALAVLGIIPIIGGTFFFILRKVRVLFKRGQEVIDWLNKVINESILGSSLIRVLNAEQVEYDKFMAANTEARDTGMGILKLFAAMIPIITFVANMASLTILALGGRFVIGGSMTLGSFAAFNSYIAILIFPILVIGFMSNVIARASASYKRISSVLAREERPETGAIIADIRGDIELSHVSVKYGEKAALKDVTLSVKGGTRTAVIGPTAAGKTQLLSLLTGLLRPDEGVVTFDGRPIDDYEKKSLHARIGFVFQDSIIFNLTLRENIAFSEKVSDEDLRRAIDTAELADFIAALPQALDTVVSERGSSLSGGQKQRIMLARALALAPTILLLDDFTARVDPATEQKILRNVEKNYPGITLVSVTQKIGAIEHFDQIVLLMEGEVLATGTHEQLMVTSPEYVQIERSQRSTAAYELRAE